MAQRSRWGAPPHWTDTTGYAAWAEGAKAFGKAVWDALGDKQSPRIVFEHPQRPRDCLVVASGAQVMARSTKDATS